MAPLKHYASDIDSEQVRTYVLESVFVSGEELRHVESEQSVRVQFAHVVLVHVPRGRQEEVQTALDQLAQTLKRPGTNAIGRAPRKRPIRAQQRPSPSPFRSCST